MDEPAVAHVDAHVADLGGLRARAMAEEDDVARLQLGVRDPPGRRDLAAHRVRRPALERVGEPARAGIRLELVDAPDEAGAIEAAGCLMSEWGLGALARPAPDVGVADEAERSGEDALLPSRERRQDERGGGVASVLRLPAVEAEHLGGR